MPYIKLRTKLYLPLIIFCVFFGGYAHFIWFDKYASSFIQNHERDIQAHLTTAAEGLIPLMLEDRLATIYGNLDALLEQNSQWLVLTLHNNNKRLLYPLEDPLMPIQTRKVRTYTQSVSFSGPSIGVLTLSVNFTDIYSSVDDMEKDFHIALTLLLLIAVISIFGIVEMVISRPVNAMSLASKKIAEGNFTGSLPVNASGEVGELVENFVNMRDSILAFHVKLTGEIENHKNTTKELLLQKELASYQASHDALTGLINRREFERRVNVAIDCSREDGSHHVLLYVDLDQFKIVNDTSGHIAGDMLLKQLSELLKEKTREHDTLSRLGGDEFGLLFEYCNRIDGFDIAKGLLDVVKDFRFSWNDKLFNVGASIGLVEFNAESGSYFDILSAADSACYSAKDTGRNRIKVYKSEDAELTIRKGEMLWTTRLITALETNKLVLYCQPIVALDGSKNVTSRLAEHYEVLLRIKGEDGEIIYPDAFISAAERYNLIGSIDRWVIENVFKFVHKYQLQQKDLDCVDIQLSVNLSGVSLDRDMLVFIENLFLKYKPKYGSIGLEITETAAIQNLSQAVIFMKELRKFGCQFYLDDFGSGLSSFNYLKSLPVDFVKIDGTFVRDIEKDPVDLAMVKSINEIGHVMGKKTIAEFVSSEKIANMLMSIGVDYAQGYHVSKPFAIDELMYTQANTVNPFLSNVKVDDGEYDIVEYVSRKVGKKNDDIAEVS